MQMPLPFPHNVTLKICMLFLFNVFPPFQKLLMFQFSLFRNVGGFKCYESLWLLEYCSVLSGLFLTCVMVSSKLIGTGPEMTVLMLVWSYEMSAWGFKHLKSMDSLRKKDWSNEWYVTSISSIYLKLNLFSYRKIKKILKLKWIGILLL